MDGPDGAAAIASPDRLKRDCSRLSQFAAPATPDNRDMELGHCGVRQWAGSVISKPDRCGASSGLVASVLHPDTQTE
jgi:hypothetical protein